MEPLRGTNLGVAEIDFKPQEGTSEKRTYRQHFNQFNEAKDDSIKYFPHSPAVF